MALSLIEEFPSSAPGTPAGGIPIAEHMGLEPLHSERGRAVLRLPFEPNINHVGMVYAGSIFTLAEVPGGVLFATAFDVARFSPIVGEMTVRFVKPAMTALLVDARMDDAEIERATAELEATGKAKWVLDQEVVDTNGDVVATTTRRTSAGRPGALRRPRHANHRRRSTRGTRGRRSSLSWARATSR